MDRDDGTIQASDPRQVTSQDAGQPATPEGYSDEGITADMADEEMSRGWSADEGDDEATTGTDSGLTDGGTGTAIGDDDR